MYMSMCVRMCICMSNIVHVNMCIVSHIFAVKAFVFIVFMFSFVNYTKI